MTGKDPTPRSGHLLFLFFVPILLSLCLFATLNFTCQAPPPDGPAEVRFLYTGEVGGALDPCG